MKIMKIKIILLLATVMMSYNSYSQYTGATPWSNCFGENASCNNYGCSAIKVNTSSSSPVVAIVKKYGKVIKHAYISAGSRYTFEVKDGTYQIFFYYGTSWNKYKRMSSDECSSIYGGWEDNENVTKDSPITLSNQIMTYTLTSVVGGNFNTKGSSLKEAL
tara:strand:- start:161 stop:643 length:483 start_codon:yes stop_codon:yes gene_type:complete